MKKKSLVVLVGLLTSVALSAQQKDTVVTAVLSYHAPGDGGPVPNFGPKGTQVPLAPVPDSTPLPPGAARPAKSGTIKIGSSEQAWLPVLVSVDAEHPADLCHLFVDRNRNGRFDDDGPALSATPTENAKTKAWWTSFNNVDLTVPYPSGKEPYMVSMWLVRDGDAPPDVLRYSVRSWRAGTVKVNGVEALVAAMDGDNDAIFAKGDYWSVVAASSADAPKAVLSHAEARDTGRLMFLPNGAKEMALEFRSFSPDGRSVTFAVVDRPTTKALDRSGDDPVAAERGRPRTETPFAWQHDFAAGQAAAKQAGRKVVLDFEATWCGPCKSMDEWVWNDREVAGVLNGAYIGVKLDGDIEKALVKRFDVNGYPTIIVLDSAGKELRRANGYLGSAEVLGLLK